MRPLRDERTRRGAGCRPRGRPWGRTRYWPGAEASIPHPALTRRASGRLEAQAAQPAAVRAAREQDRAARREPAREPARRIGTRLPSGQGQGLALRPGTVRAPVAARVAGPDLGQRLALVL